MVVVYWVINDSVDWKSRFWGSLMKDTEKYNVLELKQQVNLPSTALCQVRLYRKERNLTVSQESNAE